MSKENFPVLTLNKSWFPIDSHPLHKAMAAVISDRARFLDENYTPHDLRSWMKLPLLPESSTLILNCGSIRVPEIMLLSKFNKVPKRHVVFCRRNIWRRDNKQCQYCGCFPSEDDVTIDHLVPKSKGGATTFENCVLACTACNLKKGNRSLMDSGLRLQRHKKMNGKWTLEYYSHPVRPAWNPLYSLHRKTFPKSWNAFLKNFDESLYWEVELEN